MREIFIEPGPALRLPLQACWHDVHRADWLFTSLSRTYDMQEILRAAPDGLMLEDQGLVTCLGNRCPFAMEAGGYCYCQFWSACIGVPVRRDGMLDVDWDV